MRARRRKERCHDGSYQTQAMVIVLQSTAPFVEMQAHPDLIGTRVLLHLEDRVVILSGIFVISLLRSRLACAHGS
jgi:hypothetical protein